MLSITLKSLWSHKRRLFGTGLAVLIGVAFLSGTLVLGDTLRHNFAKLFSEANAGTDAVIRNSTKIGNEGNTPRGLIDESIVGRVSALKDVAHAEGVVDGYGQLIDENGKALGGKGPPTFAGSWITDAKLNPYRLVTGRAPRTDDEVIVNKGAADDGHFRVGDTITVRTPQPVRVHLVGIATFGSEQGIGQVTYTAFTLSGAQKHLTNQPTRVSNIVVRAAPGVSQAQLTRELRPLLPRGVESLTGTALTHENSQDINKEFLNLFTTFLTVFAVIALLVATFSIYNTFAILVAQRTRESALLRALGATQRQVLSSVVLEAVLIGLVASVVGLFAGLGIAGLLKALLAGFGFGLPAGGLVFKSSTGVIGIVTGLVVTLIAGAVPAVKASRVAPLAAMRQVAAERTTASLARGITGVVLTAAGVGTVLAAVFGGGSTVLQRAALGALLTLVGVVVFGPIVARRASGALGAPLTRLRGVTGSLARQNAMRNPRRTSGTAAALMVGVGVVTLFTVFAASLKSSLDDSVSKSFRGDLVVNTGRFGGGGFSPQLAGELRQLPQVRSATGFGDASARIANGDRRVTVADPSQLGLVLDLNVVGGSMRQLGTDGLAVSKKVADDHKWHLGTRLPAKFPDGATGELQIRAIYKSRDVLGSYFIGRAAWTGHSPQDIDTFVLIGLNKGVSVAEGKTAVKHAVASYGQPKVQNRKEYVDSIAGSVNQMLGLVYVMLILAIIIALMGIANTLSLSIYERTRELGLLRAVGQTRGQLRSMVRWESVIISTFGTVGGLGVGVFLGWALVKAASESQGIGSFAAPVGQLLIVLVVGAVVGILAGFRPARRAAKLDILEAIATQ